MFTKFMGGAAVVAGVVAMAMPAGAATTTHTTFGKNAPAPGTATLVVRPHGYQSNIQVSGLAPGTYQYRIGVYEDSNHDGVPEGGTNVRVCKFTVRHSGVSEGCRGHGRSLLKNWGASEPPDLFTAELSMVVPHTEVNVESANFS